MALTSVSTAFAVERSTSFPSQTEGTAAVGSDQSVKISQSASWNAGGEPGDATLTLTYTGAEAQVPGVQQHDYAILIDCSQSPDPIALWNACVSFVTQINKKDEGASFYVLSENGKEDGVEQLYAPNTGYSSDVSQTLAGVSKVIRGIYNTDLLPTSEEPRDDKYWKPQGGPSAGSLVSQDYVLPASMKAQDVHDASDSSRSLVIVTITDGDQVYAPQSWTTSAPKGTVDWRGDTYTVEFENTFSDANVENHGNVTYGNTTFVPSYAGYIYDRLSGLGDNSVERLKVTVTKNGQPYTEDELREDFDLPEHRTLTNEEIAKLPQVYKDLLLAYQLEDGYLPRFAMNLLLYNEFSDEFDDDTEIVSLTVNKADVQSVSSSVEDMYSIVPANAMAKYFCTDEDHYFEATNNNDYSSLIEGLITSLTKSDSMSVVIDSANFSVDEDALKQVIAGMGEGWSYQIDSDTSTVTITFPPTEGTKTVSVDIPLIAEKPLGTTQSESDQDYTRVTVKNEGSAGSAWANVTDLNGAPLTVSCDSTWLTAYDLTYHGNAQQDGTVSDMPNPETLYYAPRTEVDLEGTPTHSDVDGASVVFLGWTEEQTTKIYGQDDELPTLVTTQTMNEDRDVYAAWAYDRNGDTIPDARQITVTPADIIIYMGGDEGNEGVVNDSGQIVGGRTLPEFGFTFKLPEQLQAALRANSEDITAVSFSGAEGRKWTVEPYPGSENAEREVYSIVPAAGQKAVRVQFTTSGGNKVTSDEFEVGREVNTTFAMSLYTGAAGEVTASYDGQNYSIIIAEGTLSVRGTTSDVQYGGAPSAGKPGMSVAKDTVFRINDSDVLVDDSGVALLFDKIIDTNSENRTKALIQRAESEQGLTLPGDAEAGTRSYELRYLDLVDTHNGNTWVTATDGQGNGRGVTVFWPLPEGTNKNTEFSLVHFKDLDRDMAADDVESKIENCEVESIPVTATDTHVTFNVESGNFSPFALVWSNESAGISISKDVTADKGLTAPGADFTFNVTLKDAAGAPVTTGVTYVVYEGSAPTGNEQSKTLSLGTDGTGKITLEAGQTALLSGAPAWGSYTVQEVSLPAGFAVASGSAATHSGTLTAGDTAKIAVTNNYSVTGKAAATPVATKTLNGTAPATDQFSFTLSTDAEGKNVVDTKTNDAQGRVTFSPLSFTPANLGDNTYYIREVAGNALGYTYDDAVYKLVYTVSDNGAGGIKVSKTTITKIAADGTESSAQDVAFANTYHPVPSEPTAELSGTKTIGGQDTGEYTLEAGDFTFKVTGAVAGAPEGTTAPAPSNVSKDDGTTTNDASGAITFGTLTFVEPGTYTYTVSELQPTTPGEAIPGISYDGAGTTYTLTFKVEDKDGKLTVTDSSVTRAQDGATTDAALDKLDFENSYNPAEKSVTLGGVKRLEGRAWETADRFTFELLDENGKVIDTAEATAASPSFSFDPITYTTEGTHTYTIREVTTGLDATLTAETEPYQVKVSVDDVDAKLVATQSVTNADVVFVNSYTPTPVSLGTTISGTKTLTGRDEVKPLQAGEFTFQLLNADGSLIEEATNAAGGSFSFAFAPTYDAEGTYTYLVREKVGSVPGVTYDGSTYVVTVKVTENRAAHALEIADVTYALAQSGAAATEVDAIEFTNVYEAAPVSVALAANKQLTGRDLAADEFDFTLSDAEGAVVSQASNSAEGGVAFDPIAFDEPGVYEFTISELAGSAEGVTYDDATYAVTVTVTDDGAGALRAEVAYGTDDGTVPTFANTYTPPASATEGAEQIPGTGDPGSAIALVAAVSGAALLLASRRR